MSETPKTAAREIFADALERSDAAERERYLASACGQDEALRQEVESLLRAHLAAEAALPEAAWAMPELSVVGPPGSVIGPYKLLQEIGEGGFGVVFLAEQLVPVRRRVALKIIKAGMDTREVIARFQAERQALALMDHPCITKVLDAGTTDNGRPYFVMELVKGIPITKYCDCNKLPTSDRLRLFMQVCHAVQHAHQKGVIHRDLKPTNVLVTEVDGQPLVKIIDFGVAKAMGVRLTENTIFTRLDHQIGTPTYMSPEQAGLGSIDVDTRSDIYTLGVLLYELLTGTTPLQPKTLHQAAAEEVRRLIRDTDPPKPSTRLQTLGQKLTDVAQQRQTEPAALCKLVQGDLDWIVMKAIEKDRRRRYDTANALAEDLERHLQHHPVLASPPRTLYRARKFIRRHRIGVAMAATVTFALAVGLALATAALWAALHQRDRARAAEHETERRRQQAQENWTRAEDTLKRLDVQAVRALIEEDQAADAAATLALLLRQHPDDRVISEWLMNLLTLSSFPLPALAPLEHPRGVCLAEFSPDGHRILTASRDNCARLWDARTGQMTAELRHDPDALRTGDFSAGLMPLHAVFSADGLRVATGSADRTARIWLTLSGQPLTPPLPHSNWVTHVAFSPDGSFLATACKDGSTRLWQAQTGEPVGPPLVHEKWVNVVKFSPNGRLLLTASDDTTARLWAVPTGNPLATFRHAAIVKYAAFSPDSQRVVTASDDGTARLWNAGSGTPIGQPLLHNGSVVWAHISPDGTKVATASFDQTARIWDAFDGHPLGAAMKHAYKVRHIQFSPDGQRLVTCSQDSTARIWSVDTGAPLTEPLRHHAEVWCADFSPDGRFLVTASSDNTAQVWEALAGRAAGQSFYTDGSPRSGFWSPDGRRVLLIGPGRNRLRDAETGDMPDAANPAFCQLQNILCAQFSSDGQRLVVGTRDRFAWIFDGHGARALTRRMWHDGPVRHVEFSRDGSLVVSASDDRTACIWNAQTGRHLTPSLWHTDTVLLARVSPDAARVVTASADKTARIWNVVNGVPLTRPLQHGGAVTCAEFSPDGKWVLTGSTDFHARVWDTTSGELAGPLLTHLGPIESASFSPDGHWVLTASKDHTARVWDWRSGRPISESLTHKAELNHAAFSADGTRVITAAGDGTALLWDARSGIPLAPPLRHSLNVEDAAFSPDDRFVLTCGFDAKARTWPIVKPLHAPPAWLPDLAEAVAGQRLTAQRTKEDVPPTVFLALRQRLAKLPAGDQHDPWLRWFLADRATRTVSPHSIRLVSEVMKDRPTLSWARTQESLERATEAICFVPTNGLAFAHKASALTRIPLTNCTAQLSGLAWFTEKAISLSPDQPLPWVARGLYLAMAGHTNAALEAFEKGSQKFGTNGLYWRPYSRLLESATGGEEAYQAATKSDDLIWEQARLLWHNPNLSAKHLHEWRVRQRELLAIPPRPPRLPPELLDLTDIYSGKLDDGLASLNLWRQSLRALPQGRATLGGTEFDLRGLLLLRSAQLTADHGTTREGISVNQACHRLHFLHATDIQETNGVQVAAYVAHYADGQQQEIPVLFGRDTGAWLLEEDPADTAQPVVAWRHSPGGGITLQLYVMTWENPRAGVPIASLDFVSKMSQAAPFLVAITAEP